MRTYQTYLSFNIKYNSYFNYSIQSKTNQFIGIFGLVVLTFDVLYLVVFLYYLSLIISVYQWAARDYFLILYLLIPKK